MPDPFERYREAARREIAAMVAAKPLEHGHLLRLEIGTDAGGTEAAGEMETASVCLAMAEAFGGSVQDALPGAVALEFMETFLRVQSDITTGRSERDGRETLWMSVGLPLALNTADGMFALAQMSLLRPVADERVRLLAAGRMLDRHCLSCWEAGYQAVSETASIGTYERMAFARRCLLALAPSLGALLAGASTEASEGLAPFGSRLALLHQLRADYMRFWPGGEDEPGGREWTYPLVWAKENARLSEAPTTGLAEALDAAGARQATLEHIQDVLQASTVGLRDSGLSEGSLLRMLEVAQYVARRGVS